MKKYTWKDALMEGLGEFLIFLILLIILFIAFVLTRLLPAENIKDVPLEIFMLLSFLILLAIIGIIFLVIHIVKIKKKTKDLQYIRKSFKGKYNLVLMTLTKKFTNEDIHLLRGRTKSGKFDLYKEKDVFVFSTEYFSGPIEERAKQFQLQSIDEAILYIENFMQEKPISD